MAITSEGLQNYIDDFVKNWFDGYLTITGQNESGDVPVEYGRVFNGRYCLIRNIDELCTSSIYNGYVSYTFDLNIAPNQKYPTINWQYMGQSNASDYTYFNSVERYATEWMQYASEHFRYRPNSYLSADANISTYNNLDRFGLYNASNQFSYQVWHTDSYRIDYSTHEPIFSTKTGYTLSTPNDFFVYYVGSVPYRSDQNTSYPTTSDSGVIYRLENYPIFTTQQSYFNTYITLTNQTAYQIDVTNSDNSVTTVYYTDNGDIYYPNLNPFDFDDLLNLLNTIANAIGINNNFITPVIVPTFDDLLDIYLPSVTGGGDTYINNGDIYNIDGDYYEVGFPSFTGEYPIETIAPLSTEFFEGSLPALPALTMDNALANQTAGAVGAGFTFFDGLGLFTPFIILATVRLLVSKFRGDS